MERVAPRMRPLAAYVARIPGVTVYATSPEGEHVWWLKMSIDIGDPLAWQVVQELGHMLNYMSLNDRLPTVFKPVSPPPYLNGGPKDFLAWVIEATSKTADPAAIAKWLEGRLPRPVEDRKKWNLEDNGEEVAKAEPVKGKPARKAKKPGKTVGAVAKRAAEKR